MVNISNPIGLFPGQGSQKVGMGKLFVDSSPIAKSYFEEADDALGFSLSTLCFEGPLESLTKTEVTQPAILTTSVIAYEIAKQTHHISLAAAAGHSLGEYSALVAAGALTFRDAVILVNKRGRYMQEAVPAGAGKMVAVLGREVAAIEEALVKVTSGVVDIANINAPGQIVIAGSAVAVDEAAQILGGKIITLNVSAPFHSRLMEPARQRLAADLKHVKISPPRFPVIANFSANPVTAPEEIRASLESQVCGRVRWVESMEKIVQCYAPTVAIEFGEGSTLGGLLKRINVDIPRSAVGSPADLATFEA